MTSNKLNRIAMELLPYNDVSCKENAAGISLSINAQTLIDFFPSRFEGIFKRKKTLVPTWLSMRYIIQLKSHFLVFRRYGEVIKNYVDLRHSQLQIISKKTNGPGFNIILSKKLQIKFYGDQEKHIITLIQIAKSIQDQKYMTINNFDLLNVIGKGHYGKVFLGQMKETKKLFAIKEMNIWTTDNKVIRNERKIMEMIGYHPFILQLEYAFTEGTIIYLVSKFMMGGDLFKVVDNFGGKMNEKILQFYAAELILAIEHLHAKCIVHRDIKPENILIDKEGHVKIGDLGLAKKMNKIDDFTRTICGTDAYLAPEIIRRERNGYSGRAVDMWQLGCLFFELFTGSSPFYMKHSTAFQLYSRILHSKPVLPKNTSFELKSLLDGLLEKDATKRLGCLEGIQELKSHPFFNNLCWDKLISKQYPAPFVPCIDDDNLTANFEVQFTKMPVVLENPILSEYVYDYVGFDYVASPITSQIKY